MCLKTFWGGTFILKLILWTSEFDQIRLSSDHKGSGSIHYYEFCLSRLFFKLLGENWCLNVLFCSKWSYHNWKLPGMYFGINSTTTSQYKNISHIHYITYRWYITRQITLSFTQFQKYLYSIHPTSQVRIVNSNF